jgi:hypothetical protein
MNFDEHLPTLERRHLNFVDDERLALLDKNSGGCFHETLTEARRHEGLE